MVPVPRHKSCLRTILVLVPRHKSSPSTILVPVPRQIQPRNNPGACSTSQILPWYLFNITNPTPGYDQEYCKGVNQDKRPCPHNDQEYFEGMIRMNDSADIHRRNGTVYHITGSGATRSRSPPRTNQDKSANPHIDRFHIPIRINDPAHITIDSTFNLSI